MIYEFDPSRFGINPLGSGLGQAAGGIMSGLLLRNDPRNIEIRRNWLNPEAHATDYGWAPKAPKTVKEQFDLIGGLIPVTDALGRAVIDPATGKQAMQWDRRVQRKGSPIPPGYQLMIENFDPYKAFPGRAAETGKKEALPNYKLPDYNNLLTSIMKSGPGLNSILGNGSPPPLYLNRMEEGGKVEENNPLKSLVTLMEMERGTKKNEVPAILHEGEGVVTKGGMRILNMIGGVDAVNQLGKSIPKMEKGGEVKKPSGGYTRDVPDYSNLERILSAIVTLSQNGMIPNLRERFLGVTPLPKEGEKEQSKREDGKPAVTMSPYTWMYNTPDTYTKTNAVDPLSMASIQPMSFERSGADVRMVPYTTFQDVGEKKRPGYSVTIPEKERPGYSVTIPEKQKEVEKKEEGLEKGKKDERLETNVAYPMNYQAGQPGYRGWNAPLGFSMGQLGNMSPMDVLGAVQSDVEGRGLPFPGPVYGSQGEVLQNRPTATEQRLGLQNQIFNQYLNALGGQMTQAQTEAQKQEISTLTPDERRALWKAQAEKAKMEAELYPAETRARIAQIENQIKYNNAMLERAGQSGGLSPEDALKLAQIDKINSDLSQAKLKELENAIKTAKGSKDKRLETLLLLEYTMTLYPQLAEIGENNPDEIIKYLGKKGLNWEIMGIKFDPDKVSLDDVKNMSMKVNGSAPIKTQTQGANLLNRIATGQNPSMNSPVNPPPRNELLLNKLAEAQKKYIK